jgi:tetratricopeptide (TPR) repeat protein
MKCSSFKPSSSTTKNRALHVTLKKPLQHMKTKLTLACLALSLITTAQTLEDAILKTKNERFEAADADFKTLIGKEPGKGDYYFYYGENFFENEDMENANTQFQKGSEVNATYPLNYVGLGKVLWYKGKEGDAKAMFYKAATLGGNKNAEVMRQTAEAYIYAPNKNLDEAIKLLNEAIKLDPKNPMNYILLGDAQLEKNPTDGSTPIKSYQKASELNPKSTLGILREGKLYQRGRNYQLALELYKKAIGIDPNFAPAYREIAEVYMLAGQAAKAIENWKKYLELNNSDYARYRYMSALFNNKQYKEAIEEGENLKKKGYSDPSKVLYIERLLGYSYDNVGTKGDTSSYSKGLNSMYKFFELGGQKFKYIADDYKHTGALLSKLGKDSLGTLELEKGIALDPTGNCELWADVARIWTKAKNYPKSIAAWEKRMGCTKAMTGQDHFELGRAYYFAGNNKMKEAATIKDAKAKSAKEAEANPFYVKADSSFSKLIQSAPNFAAGYFWRGRSSSQLDPTSEFGLAKPYYEKALELAKPEEKTGTYKSNVTEAYEYLGFYYFLKNNKKANPDSDKWFNELKTIEPNNEKAKNYFNPPKGNAPKK